MIRAQKEAGFNVRVYLSFDVEVWCQGWQHLDDNFPWCFERYVRGRSSHGDYALPKTLDILAQHSLQGVFFVEALFAARFGREHLRHIVELIAPGGHDIQLHLHAEWADEIQPPLLRSTQPKRAYLSQYSLDDQTILLAHGRALLEAETGQRVQAFRAGNYAVNADTYRALERLGIFIDSSLNELHAHSGADLVRSGGQPTRVGAVRSYPIAVFRDGLGRPRPAQVGACSFEEMRDALDEAQTQGCQDFVIVSHNFEMMKLRTSLPDAVVVRRFERLCAYLGAHRSRFQVGAFSAATVPPTGSFSPDHAAVGFVSTLRRHGEQIMRRLN